MNLQTEINGIDIEKTRSDSFSYAKRRGLSVDQANDFSSYALMFLLRRKFVPQFWKLLSSFSWKEYGGYKAKGYKKVLKQRIPFEEKLHARLTNPSPEYNPNNYKFTDLERLIISLMAQGYHLQDMPKLAGVSRFTVRETVKSIYKVLERPLPPKGKPLIKVDRQRLNHKDVPSTCHPEKKVKGYGFCRACYMRHYRAGTLPGKRIGYGKRKC